MCTHNPVDNHTTNQRNRIREEDKNGVFGYDCRRGEDANLRLQCLRSKDWFIGRFGKDYGKQGRGSACQKCDHRISEGEPPAKVKIFRRHAWYPIAVTADIGD